MEMAKQKKDPVVKTKRLSMRPMTDAELEKLIEETPDEELKVAYGEMLANCKAHPEDRIWYTTWGITLKKEGTFIGDVGFKGPAKHHAVEIGYGLPEEYWGKGYATEAVDMLSNWAFSNEEVYFVEAETEPTNKASQRILEKLGFVPDGEGAEGPRFVKESYTTSWMSIYMCLGISVGMSIGVAMKNVGIGMCLGIAIGVGIGAMMDSNAKKQREAAKAERDAARSAAAEKAEE